MTTLGAVDRRFPRAGGVIVPMELRELCRAAEVTDADADPSSLSNEQRQRLARETVRAVSRHARRLRQEILHAPLPTPETVLRTLPLDDRTRCALERLRPSLLHVTSWSIERYLRLPKFGPHCLVDLLAAREEAAHPNAAPAAVGTRPPARRGRVRREPPFDPRNLDAISALLVRRAPFAGADVGPWLVEAGLAARPLAVREIAAGYKQLGVDLPIRIARHRGIDVAVPPGTVGVASAVIATAVRFVSEWGLATVESIGDRVRALRATSVAREIAGRVIVALPRFLWIDESGGWFTLRGVRSRLATAVRQAFAIANRIRLDELARALTRRKTRLPELTIGVLTNYLRSACDCEVVDGWVLAGAIAAAVPLSAEEESAAALVARRARRNAADRSTSISAATLESLLDEASFFPRGTAGRAHALAAAP